jgi:hypothetical protein
VTTTTRRYSNDPPEEKLELFRTEDSFVVSQLKDNRNFWRIECNCSSFHKAKAGLAKWCDHAQDLLKTHHDVHEGRMLNPTVRVTVIINPALEAWFTLDDPDENGFRQVHLVVPDMSSPATACRYFLRKPMGLIHFSSGRLELRTMMLEWLISLTVEGLDCRASTHQAGSSPYENMEEYVTSRGNPGFAVLVDVFDLFTTGNCRACNQAMEVDL